MTTCIGSFSFFNSYFNFCVIIFTNFKILQNTYHIIESNINTIKKFSPCKKCYYEIRRRGISKVLEFSLIIASDLGMCLIYSK